MNIRKKRNLLLAQLNIREIRNQIAHEYVDSDIKALFLDVMVYVPEMKKIIKNVKIYYDKNLSSEKTKKE